MIDSICDGNHAMSVPDTVAKICCDSRAAEHCGRFILIERGAVSLRLCLLPVRGQESGDGGQKPPVLTGGRRGGNPWDCED